MFCINCGTPLPDNTRFCIKCGKSTAAVYNSNADNSPSKPLNAVNSASENETIILSQAPSSESATVILPKPEAPAPLSEAETVLLNINNSAPSGAEDRTVLLNNSTSGGAEDKTVLLNSSAPSGAEDKTVLLNNNAPSGAEDRTVLLNNNAPSGAEDRTVLLNNNAPSGAEDKTVLLKSGGNLPLTQGAQGEIKSRKKSELPRSPKKAKKQRSGFGKIIIPAIAIIAAIAAFVAVYYYNRNNADIERAQTYLSEGNYDLAEKEIDRLIISNPTDEDGYLVKAEIYIAQERYDDALEVLSSGFKKTNSDKIWDRLSEIKEEYAEELVNDGI